MPKNAFVDPTCDILEQKVSVHFSSSRGREAKELTSNGHLPSTQRPGVVHYAEALHVSERTGLELTRVSQPWETMALAVARLR